jgi:hypothetical protein
VQATGLTELASGSSPDGPGVLAETLPAAEEYYVNVHNAPFPNGAVRGQLS